MPESLVGEFTKDNFRAAYQTQEQHYNKNVWLQVHWPRDRVLLFLRSAESKLVAKWQGPIEILRWTGDVYTTQPEKTTLINHGIILKLGCPGQMTFSQTPEPLQETAKREVWIILVTEVIEESSSEWWIPSLHWTQCWSLTPTWYSRSINYCDSWGRPNLYINLGFNKRILANPPCSLVQRANSVHNALGALPG